MLLGTLQHIRRYPVKSMGGEQVDIATLSQHGLLGDRAYALFDSTEPRVVSATNTGFPKLLDFHARYLAEPETSRGLPPIEIALPDGQRIRSDDPACLAVLSSCFGHRVQLGAITDDEARRPAAGKYAMAGTFFDYAPLHLLTDAALASVASTAPESSFAVERFRPNLLIASTSQDSYPENDWTGKFLRIGAAVVVEVTDPCPRCAMPTLAQGELPKDPAILKRIAKSNTVYAPVLGKNEPCLGSYAFVKQGGIVRTGDTIRAD
jgi:MOSC domain-containing protein